MEQPITSQLKLQTTKMNFEFTEKEANIILNSLVKQPYEVVFKLVENLMSQAKEQTKPETNPGD